AERCDVIAREMRETLDAAKAEGRRVIGYGAAAKGCTMIAWCGITGDDLDYVIDANPYKHGRYMGGVHVPIVEPSTLDEDQPDDVVILAWNFAEEIMSQQRNHLERGGRFIVPVPRPRIVTAADQGVNTSAVPEL
ncbi:MAG: methyltransferase C-terminal domain-containing protein, partial [Actinomycetota bacterium]